MNEIVYDGSYESVFMGGSPIRSNNSFTKPDDLDDSQNPDDPNTPNTPNNLQNPEDKFDEVGYIDSIKEKILIELPFTEMELTDSIMKRALSKGFDDMNQYHPKMIRLSGVCTIKGSRLLRSYSNNLDDTSIIPYIEEIGVGSSIINIYSVPWTYESLSEDRLASRYYKSLVTYYAGLFMANIRRSATMNNLPFDIKGEEFYSQIKESLDSLIEKIIDSARNSI